MRVRKRRVGSQLKWTVRGKESVIINYCRPEEQKALLTSNRGYLHEDMESSIGGLDRPVLEDGLSVKFEMANTKLLGAARLVPLLFPPKSRHLAIHK